MSDGASKPFACRRCGICCHWTDCVRVTDEEVEATADLLRMPERVTPS